MSNQKTKAQLRAENQFLRRSRATEGVTSVINNLIRWAGVVLICRYGYLTIAELAGVRLWVAESHGLPRYDTVQNNFSLLNRRCESELAQVCRRESVGLIAYSPLAGGVLTGKYQDGALPGGARFTDYIAGEGERQRRIAARFVNPRTLEATSRFLEIARDLGTSGAALATEWSRHHDFVASTLVGATTLPQLEESLAAESLVLDETTLAVLDAVEDEIPLSFGEDGLRKL